MRPSDLRTIPLFADIPDESLGQLMAAFVRRPLGRGEVLFEEGSAADHLLVLAEGAIEIRHGEERFTIRPVAPIGEVGALGGLLRATTAVAVEPSVVLSIPTEDLLGFFERHGAFGARFHKNFLAILADKITRDRRRIAELQHNVIEAQKAMKRMRDALLEAEDTPMVRVLFEELDAIIEHNRRGHYHIDVPRALPARLRLDDGAVREVLRMSNEHLWVAAGPGALPPDGSDLTCVLVLDDAEIPIAGSLAGASGGATVIAIGPLIDEYAEALERYLVRMQLLDIVL